MEFLRIQKRAEDVCFVISQAYMYETDAVLLRNLEAGIAALTNVVISCNELCEDDVKLNWERAIYYLGMAGLVMEALE